MDNFTLLITLNIILAVNLAFTFSVKKEKTQDGVREWKASSVLLSLGFFMLVMQPWLPAFISILFANYIILLGFYFQVTASLRYEFRKSFPNSAFLIILSAGYWSLFLVFTYVRFDTSARIVIISALLAAVYIYYVLSIRLRYHKIHAGEMLILFLASAIFYLARIVLTLTRLGHADSIIERNMITTATFFYINIYSVVYITGMFNATLKINNSSLLKEREKQSYLFKFLNDTVGHLNLPELYSSIDEVLKNSLGIDMAIIYLLDEEQDILSIARPFDDPDIPLEQIRTMKKGEGAAGRAVAENRVIEIDIEEYPDSPWADILKNKGVTKIVSLPLRTAEGVIGAITGTYTGTRQYHFLDREFFCYLAEQIGLVLNNAFLYEKVKVLANTDPLTNLTNRRRMLELIRHELYRADRSRQGFSLAMADIDHFKKINDSYGHDCGDKVLVSAAAIFRDECRDSDYVCRWGGEEFLLLFIDTDLEESLEAAERIRSVFERQGHECVNNRPMSLSIGITGWKPGATIEQMILRADKALYAAKNAGRNRIEVR